MNGDGFGDVVIGALLDNGQVDEGQARVFAGSARSGHDTSSVLRAERADSRFASCVAEADLTLKRRPLRSRFRQQLKVERSASLPPGPPRSWRFFTSTEVVFYYYRMGARQPGKHADTLVTSADHGVA